MGFLQGKYKTAYIPYGVLFFAVLFLVGVPLLTLVFSSISVGGFPFESTEFSLQNFRVLWTEPGTLGVLWNTALYALLSLFISFICAFPLAFCVERTNMPGKKLVYILIVASMATPGMLTAMAWTFLINPNTGLINIVIRWVLGLEGSGPLLPGLFSMGLVEGLRLSPSMFLMIAGAVKNLDPALEEAGFTCGVGFPRTVMRITLPLLTPAIVGSLVYFLIIAMEGFEIPLIFGLRSGVHVLSTRIYWLTHPDPGLPSYGMAGAFAMVLTACAFFAMLTFTTLINRKAKQYQTISGKGYRPRQMELGKLKIAAVSVVSFYFLLILILPLCALAWTSLLPYYVVPSVKALSKLSLSAYTSLLSASGVIDGIKNTVILAVTCAFVLIVLGYSISWCVVRSRFKGRSLLGSVAFIPQSIPSIVIGFSLLIFYAKIPLPIYGTLAVISIAYITRYLPYTTRTISDSLMQIGTELEEAAQVSGAKWMRINTKVLLPLISPAILNTLLWVITHVFRELAMALMLFSPKSTLLSTTIWGLWEGGRTGSATALGVLLIFFLIGITLVIRLMPLRAAPR